MPHFAFLSGALLVAFMTLSGAGSLPQAEAQTNFNIVTNAQPVARIVISSTASVTEQYAATELQSAIKKMSGATLPIVNSASGSMSKIVIGTPSSSSAVASANLFATTKDEETRVLRRNSTLFLAGKTPRVALYAVYTFLQETLGARWYWPGASGEYLPSRPSIAVNVLNITRIPTVAYRSLSINGAPHYEIETATWMARNFMNLHNLEGLWDATTVSELKKRGFQTMIAGHNAYFDDAVNAAHPDYVAMVQGQRNPNISAGNPPHICWGNADARAAFVQKMRSWWDANPTLDSVSIFGPDHMNFCECALCVAYAPDVSTRWQKFCKDVIAQLNTTHPGKKYQTLAYQSYRDVPSEVAPFDLNGYCTYNINYTKPITDATSNVARQEIQGWQSRGGQMGLRGYQFIIFNEPMYVPQTGIIMDEAKWASYTSGLRGWTSEVFPYDWPSSGTPEALHWRDNWKTNRMALYAVAQTLWNPATPTDALLTDWANTIYGPAAAPMKSYYTMMENAWKNNSTPISYCLHPAAGYAGTFISESLLEQAEGYFDAAHNALNGIADAAKRARIDAQIDAETAMLNQWRAALRLQQGNALHYQGYAARVLTTPQMTADANDLAWQNAPALPDFVDSNDNTIAEKTEAFLLWDDNALYLRFVGHDANMAALRGVNAPRDSNLFNDDGIEFFLEDKTQSSHYLHMMANIAEARYDAKADGAMNFDTSWNPDWTTNVSRAADRWIMDVKLPFASFGVTPQDGAQWKMGLRRSGAERRVNSGWPDASYHNVTTFGTVKLVQTAPLRKRVLVYNAGGDSASLPGELARLGFEVRSVASDESQLSTQLANGTDALVIKASGNFALSDAFMNGAVNNYLNNGGLVLITSYGAVQMNNWFGANAAVQWDGDNFDVARKTTWYQVGNWATQPNDLTNTIVNGITPVGGYSPVGAGWEILAKSKLATGQETSYLMRHRMGNGTLVLTSSAFSFSGGYEMFGNLCSGNAAQLLDNLLSSHRAQP